METNMILKAAETANLRSRSFGPPLRWWRDANGSTTPIFDQVKAELDPDDKLL